MNSKVSQKDCQQQLYFVDSDAFRVSDQGNLNHFDFGTLNHFDLKTLNHFDLGNLDHSLTTHSKLILVEIAGWTKSHLLISIIGRLRSVPSKINCIS